MKAFGPVPSRRLGRSIGINNIPAKICSYTCVYCQIGRSLKMTKDRAIFYEPRDILEDVGNKVMEARQSGEDIDYLTFVPDGEPTLDINLGKEIDLLRSIGIKIAVITNASLVWRDDVRRDIANADWVSLKVDAVDEDVWRKVDRPHRGLRLDMILEGMLDFSKEFGGELVTETMLVAGMNDMDDELNRVAVFLGRLKPSMSYISIPTRPPSETWVEAPGEDVMGKAYHIFSAEVKNVEYLIGYEGNAFAFTGDVEQDILGITSVHPMREDAVKEFLGRAGSDWSVIEDLLERGDLRETVYKGKRFYLRRFRKTTQ